MPARFSQGEAHRGGSGGRRCLARWRRVSQDDVQLDDVHAEAMELTVASTSSWWASVEVADGDGYGTSWTRSRERWDLGGDRKLANQREGAGEPRGWLQPSPRPAVVYSSSSSSPAVVSPRLGIGELLQVSGEWREGKWEGEGSSRGVPRLTFRGVSSVQRGSRRSRLAGVGGVWGRHRALSLGNRRKTSVASWLGR
jgi:hypothetical protein